MANHEKNSAAKSGGANTQPAQVKSGKKKSGGKTAAAIILALLLILLVLFVAASWVSNHFLNKINHEEETPAVVPAAEAVDEITEADAQSEAPVVESSDVEWAEVELQKEGLINILLVGQDSRVGVRERSDSMILCSINPESGEISLISFMRDLYVQMPEGYQDNRMNAAYAFGGFPYLYEVLEKNFGITCDGGFEVNFDGFTSVVDIMGGVDVELTSAEANYMGNGLSAGMNHLDGELALKYSRIRYLDSDFYRTGRQRNVLLALFDKIKGSDMATLLDLANTLLPLMTTDMTNTQMVSLIMKLAPVLTDAKINSYRIPTNDGYYNATIRGMMVLVPDLNVNRIALEEDFLPYSD